MGFIGSYVRRRIGMVCIALTFLLIETTTDLLQPTLMSQVVDEGVTQRDISSVMHWGAFMLAAAALGAIAAVVRNIYSSRFSQLIGRDIRSDTFSKVMRLPFPSVDRLRTSAIITRITNDVVQIQNFTQGMTRIMLKAPITCIGAIALIIIQIPRQTAIIVIVVLICAGLTIMSMRAGFPRFMRAQKALDSLGNVSREFLVSVRVIKSFGAEDREQRKFSTAAGHFARATVSASRISAVYGPLTNLTVNAGIIALLWLSRTQSPAKIGILMACVNYMTQVLFALGRVSAILNTAVRASASAHRIEEIFDEPDEQFAGLTIDEIPMERHSHLSMNRVLQRASHGENTDLLTFNHVTFTHPGASAPSLNDLCLQMKDVSTLGIIGPTGSGKTTLITMIPRFYKPQQGQIRFRGMPLNSIDLDDLRSHMALVPQHPVLFTGTVRSNLLWGNPSASDDELWRAIRRASADEFIEHLGKGIDSVIGQGGVNLSGGQQQRLSLARALLRKPDLLILDDCTSALDGSTEARVLESLRDMAAESNGMSMIVVSQRISTVRGMDEIVVMNEGGVSGAGTHDHLLHDNEQYQAIYESQIGPVRV
ncbi:MAG: ABC transporter ATP-binding protein [Bifidobacterium aquikefiri]|uniref:ABC transporter n=1 Tax=Bifidobacterium aquikefiri TaxID=1653207 RepID=A0A261G3Y1_9BIFI|nr:ABC transporter ATP-binding protein [Bifidobacterium aquikefiri]OZG66122.1 ABC transporter [Bifidobacterium aquikefiri]